MNRRKALRNIGLSAGFMAASPGLLSLLQSCTSEQASWVPEHLTADQGTVLRALVDVILPKSDTPSATEVNVPEFMDKYIGNALEESEMKFMQWTMDGLVGNLKEAYGDDVSDISTENYVEFLNANLREASKDGRMLSEKVSSYAEAMAKGEEITGDAKAVNYEALKNIREMAVFAYKNSEKVGEQVLVYDPVPGGYNGCGSLQELTGGKAWSL
ncbi:gluconate 2-dehydrogenase subunit 3 family protein [Robertkochia flava]|uniref:gluconate 2-dehydrogenase subunit 3 family protein n=1 Tax=Robertkochia flava TaxID=3447986 RepID=UPI001CCC6CE6|nr:gluconate 2-dehydrogenase subunit 3 family protein [Robertkochia marina]